MSWYSVEVIDRQTRMQCVIGQMLTKAEALKLANAVKAFNACEVQVKEFHWYNKKGKLL